MSSDPWIQNGCTLFQYRKPPVSFPGNQCVFLPDGSFISATSHSLKRISPALAVLWELPGHFHHQLNLSPDRSRLLALSSEIISEEGKKYRGDVFLVISPEGKILHRKTARSILEEKNVPRLKGWPRNEEVQILNADEEISHFNSIYEIPENSQSGNSWLKPGNIIVNGNGQGIFILSADLSAVLYYLDYPPSRWNNLHDVQVTEKGEFLIFNNMVFDSGSVYSAVEKFDPLKKKLTWRFTAEPKEMFYSATCGGVQELGDLIFFSHVTVGGYVYSRTQKKIIRFFAGTNGNPRGGSPVQQLKFPDPATIEEFFRHRK